jgi:hypothetical protein
MDMAWPWDLTEEEWLECSDPETMLEQFEEAGERIQTLLAAACLRRIWNLLPGPRCRAVVDTLERYADGQASAEELEWDRNAAREEMEVQCPGFPDDNRAGGFAGLAASASHLSPIVFNAAEATGWARNTYPRADSVDCKPEHEVQCALARDILGDPFRPVTLDPSWRTSTVVDLAHSIYTDRTFDRMPILGDALEVAGCDNRDILDHCRGPGEHVRGCWVVDLILDRK